MDHGTIRLVIEMNAQGGISVNGPINNKALCYGMLEAAKDAVRDYVAKQQSPILKPGVQEVERALAGPLNGGH